MKQIIIILLLINAASSHAQQPPLTLRHEQQLENLAEREETAIDDELFLQQLEIFRSNPINLNTAAQDELQQLQLLNSLQVKAMLQYRALFGKFIHLYELQAIPYWDVQTIQRLLPYVTISNEVAATSLLSSAMKSGASSLLFRLSRSAPKAAGFTDTSASRFLGSPEKILVRYRYNHKNLLQFGVLGEKDAGEELFDFYSIHLFARKLGIVQSLAVGDFTVNMGQGLIQWQGMAFGKGELTAIKRQSAILRPYNSAGEYNFHRGLGITLQQKRFLLTAFYSLRRLSANLVRDSLEQQAFITSFLTSGLHRNENELAERNNIRQQAAGCSISYDHTGWHIGGNILQYQFSNPVLKRQEPYNLFAFRGRRLVTYSIDYDYTFRNLHLFGEIAADTRLNKAMINGLLLSMDRRLDISVLMRRLDPGFQPFNGSAFTESSQPSNESGVFIGLAFRPAHRIKIDAYADIFRFPWLKSRADAPSAGREYQVQLMYQPRKGVELASRFRTKLLQTNSSGDTEPFHFLSHLPKTSWRTHVAWQPGPGWQASQRMELVWYGGTGGAKEQGYLLFADMRYEPPDKPYSLGGRLQLFETDGFNSRIYAVEQDAPFAATAAYQKGLRCYFNFQVEVLRGQLKPGRHHYPKIKIWLRWAATLAEMQAGTASGSKEQEYKIQVIFSSF